MKKSVAAISLSAALIAGGAVGVALGLPGTSGAETPVDTTAVTAAPSTDAASTPTPAAAAATPALAGDATDPAVGAATSNEDPTHETGESAAREADELSGNFHGGQHGDHLGGGSNEDATHEASESPAREAEEDAAPAAQATAPTTTPATTVAPSNA